MKSNPGFCVICEQETEFIEFNEWLRDYYFCKKCRSIPRQRALVNALNIFSKNWRDSVIHESSPCGPSSDYIRSKCKHYSESQLFNDVPLGSSLYGIRCENLENMTFEDESFDIFITQDVFEHVLRPELAFKEINRVLKPDGIHIFTMPWYQDLPQTVPRVKINNGSIEHLMPPIYHGNPVDKSGSLVTYDWGIDFIDFIYRHGKMFTTIFLNIDRNLGLNAEFLHVFISRKMDRVNS